MARTRAKPCRCSRPWTTWLPRGCCRRWSRWCRTASTSPREPVNCQATRRPHASRPMSLPWAREQTGATADPRRTAIAGKSYGGLASVFAGLRRPDVFGTVIAQSGSFWWAPEGEEPEWLHRQVDALPKELPVRFCLDVGLQEGDWMIPQSRRLAQAADRAQRRRAVPRVQRRPRHRQLARRTACQTPVGLRQLTALMLEWRQADHSRPPMAPT
jgi:hypothetical protein